MRRLARATPAGHWPSGAAAGEDVLEIVATDSHHLARLAWHLGNRHLPTEILPERLRIRYDHVIEDMLSKLGARLARCRAPFQPEGGAYEGHHTMDDAAYKLLAWFSPAMPIGAYSYSHGLSARRAR